MKTKMIILILVVLGGKMVVGQSKKELRATVLRLQMDSTAKERQMESHSLLITSLKSELATVKTLKEELQSQLEESNRALRFSRDSLSDALSQLSAYKEEYNDQLDSLITYSRITNFIKCFYASLETSEEEDLRQHEFGDMKFSLENFNSLVSHEARYSKERVKNLSDQKTHSKYFIMLEDIEEIKFSLDKILVKTKVMYSGENMGLYYNLEQLTLSDNKGLLKLTDWVDLDLYKIAPTIEWNDQSFTRDDFYRWIDGSSR